MKIKALVTLLVLGSSSLALADSYRDDTYGPMVRDHRYTQPVASPLPAPPVVTAPQAPVAQYHGQLGFGWRKPALQLRPVLLADDARVSGWSMINVSQTNRTFTKLELKAASGRTDLDRVLITFGNGQRQVVSLRGKQEGKINAQKSLTIDLDGGARNIKSIMLIGSSGRRGSIDVVAV